MVFITHKVLNQLHTDTIACVLYELLVCQSLGFGIVYRDFPSRLRFHKFQYCSIFKVLLALFEKAYLLYQRSYFLSSTFFDIFLSFPLPLKSFSQVRYPVPRCVFAWCIAFIWLSVSCCLARQLIYNTTLSSKVKHFFRFSS